MTKTRSPKGPFTLTPYIIVKGAEAAIAFYTKVLGAKEQFRIANPDGGIGHAELAIGDGGIMLAEESPAFGALSPLSIGGTAVKLHLYVEDEARAGPILWRSVRHDRRSLRPSMVPRHTQGGGQRRRNAEALQQQFQYRIESRVETSPKLARPDRIFTAHRGRVPAGDDICPRFRSIAGPLPIL
jgi:catechol 2,3-dioxygenase-like lactoylglutathione lyase family enzyme